MPRLRRSLVLTFLTATGLMAIFFGPASAQRGEGNGQAAAQAALVQAAMVRGGAANLISTLEATPSPL